MHSGERLRSTRDTRAPEFPIILMEGAWSKKGWDELGAWQSLFSNSEDLNIFEENTLLPYPKLFPNLWKN